MWAVLGHRVVGIGGGQQPSAEVELIGLGAAVIPGAIGALVVAGGHVGVGGEEPAPTKHSFTEVGVEPDPLPLLGAERAGVIPDAARHPDTPDVVHQRGLTHRGRVRVGQARGSRGGVSESGDTSRMPSQPHRLQIGEIRHRGERTVEPPGLDPQARSGLSLEHLSAWIVSDRGQPSFTLSDEGVDDRRVIGVPPTVTEHLDRSRPAGLAGPQLDVAGNGDDTHRHWHLLAGQTVRQALAVPALIGVGEGPEDGFGQSQPSRQTGGHLTMTRQAASLRPGIGQRPHDPADPPVQREILRQVNDEVPHPLTGLSHRHRRHRPQESDVIPARQHRRLRRIRGAADEPQQRCVVHGRSCRPVQARAAPRPRATANRSATPAPSAGRARDRSPTTTRSSTPPAVPTGPHRPPHQSPSPTRTCRAVCVAYDTSPLIATRDTRIVAARGRWGTSRSRASSRSTGRRRARSCSTTPRRRS